MEDYFFALSAFNASANGMTSTFNGTARANIVGNGNGNGWGPRPGLRNLFMPNNYPFNTAITGY